MSLFPRGFQGNVNHWSQSSDFVLGFWAVIESLLAITHHYCQMAQKAEFHYVLLMLDLLFELGWKIK
jgi:hypothetical protein